MIHRADILNGVLLAISVLFSAGCTKEVLLYCNESELEECRVAVVLPLSDGQKDNWQQCLEICSNNLTEAFCKTGNGVRLVYEWYEEQSADLRKTAEELAARNDIKAVIGGQYSDDALVLAEVFSEADKPLFTIATTDQLIRGYSNWGNLWAMTETDITQCEVLLTKAIQYGAKSVALIVDGESAYGDTFVDWFPFQALELGVRNAGVFTCLGDAEKQTRAALATDADYILCTLTHTETLKDILTTYNSTPHTAKLLMSNSAYMSDVITNLGELVEGVEGVSFGPDPSSGFEVIYGTIIGRPLLFGESQVYDDDHILLIMEDDLAYNDANPEKGVLYSRMDGVNVYKNVKVDYHISDLQPSDFKEILLGRKSSRLPQVLESDADDNVLVFWSGHGSPGYLEFGSSEISRAQIEDCLNEMEKVGNYRQSIWFVEACYSGSVAKAADNHNHIIAFTATGSDESSKGDEYNPNWKVWMSNRFSATLQDCMKTDPKMALSDLYYRLFQSTVGSHVNVYGIKRYGSLYSHTLEEIF